MRLTFWGVRGSMPHSLNTPAWSRHFELLMQRFFERGYQSANDIQKFINSLAPAEVGGYGTATTCVQVESGASSVIIDGGSGIKSLSDAYLQSPSATNKKEFHILLTHFHFDHIMGLPFFLPHFLEGYRIHYYSPHAEMKKVVSSLFEKPLFPVSFAELKADLQFHTIAPYETTSVNGLRVTPYQTDHPDLCFGYRIEDGRKIYAHSVDNEAVRVTETELGRDAGLYRGADLLYIDAQYDDDEIENKKGWGHGSGDRAFQICTHFNIKQVLLAHHDPAFSIEDSLRQKAKVGRLYQARYENQKINWDFAYEGLVVDLE